MHILHSCQSLVHLIKERIEVLLHCQCFFHIQIHELTVAVCNHTVLLAFAEHLYRLAAKCGSIHSVLTGRAAAAL